MFVSYQYYWLTLRFPKNELHFKVTFLLKGRSGIHHFFVHFSAFSPLIPFHSNNQPLLNCLCSDSQFYLIIKYRQNYFVTSILTLQIKLCHLICCRLLLGVLLTVYRYDLSHPSQHMEGSWNWAPVILLLCCVKLYLLYLFIFLYDIINARFDLTNFANCYDPFLISGEVTKVSTKISIFTAIFSKALL